MRSFSSKDNKRRQSRHKAVLPVRVRGKDTSGNFFEELAHTLDVTPTGARLGAIHHDMDAAEQLTVCYRQRKIEFRVIWTRKLEGLSEYHVGLEAVAPDAEAWGFNRSEFQAPLTAQAAVSRASGV